VYTETDGKTVEIELEETWNYKPEGCRMGNNKGDDDMRICGRYTC